MLRAIAFIVPAIFMMSLASPPCLADEQGTKQEATPTPPKKPEARTRGFQRSAPPAASAPASAAPAPSPKGDGGRPDETIGGLPGHSMDEQGKQP